MDNYKSTWDKFKDHVKMRRGDKIIGGNVITYRKHKFVKLVHDGKEHIAVTHPNGNKQFFGDLRPLTHTLDIHYPGSNPVRMYRQLRKKYGEHISDNNSRSNLDPTDARIMGRYESTLISFKDFLNE